MTLFGGRRGIVVNAENTCAAPQIATARFVGKNNLGERLRPRIKVGCPKHRRKHPRKGSRR
jgi:hypothetical protein